MSRSAFTSIAKLRLFATAGGLVGYAVVETFDLPGGGTWNAYARVFDDEATSRRGLLVAHDGGNTPDVLDERARSGTTPTSSSCGGPTSRTRWA